MVSYKARVGKKYPQGCQIGNLRQVCMWGISLNNEHLMAKTTAIKEWIDKRFDTCYVFITDYISRNTNKILYPGISEEEALSKSFKLGEDYIKSHQSLLDTATNCVFQFIRCSDILQIQEYHNHLQYLLELVEINNIFKETIELFADSFCSKYSTHLSVDISLQNELSKHYLLEELAMISCWVDRKNVSVFLYQGGIEFFSRSYDSLPEGYAYKKLAIGQLIVNRKKEVKANF